MKIHEILGMRVIEGDVGVEIECEGKNLPANHFGVWKAVPDGSLRNGIEYVFKKPLSVKAVEAAMGEIHKAFKEHDTQPDFSFRTSVHVHVNCLTLEYNHLLNYIYTYLLLESVLMEFCGEARKCNRFCLRLEDAEGMLDVLRGMFSYRDTPGNLRALWREDTMRYAALNIEALTKYGSLEFRAMHGTVDTATITSWTDILVNIRKFATRFEEPKDIALYLDANGPETLLSEAVGDKHYDVLAVDDFANRILFNNSISIDLPYTPVRKAVKEDKVRPEEMAWFDDEAVYVINGISYSIKRLKGMYGGGDAIAELQGCKIRKAGPDATHECLQREGELLKPAYKRVRLAPAPVAPVNWGDLANGMGLVDGLELDDEEMDDH